jgi:hypothetical protein
MGNTARELFAGKQCDTAGSNCQALPAKRLYSGATWDLTLPFETAVSYKTVAGSMVRERQF